ncbi:putative mitochondrial carrier protein [Microcella alkaliphila]|uniref:Putative mitochondrial carrier protein n=1 Tax=Microcella alkaliphila TaxID=279828 RepID=A0A0U5BSX8_9MICO|nr:putative mitochondrial carrier protein [Microcella alkaliphila]
MSALEFTLYVFQHREGIDHPREDESVERLYVPAGDPPQTLWIGVTPIQSVYAIQFPVSMQYCDETACTLPEKRFEEASPRGAMIMRSSVVSGNAPPLELKSFGYRKPTAIELVG